MNQTSMENLDVNVDISIPTDTSDKLYTEFKDVIGTQQITQSNIVNVVINLMKLAETYPSLKGVQKKALVMHVLTHFIKDTVSDSTIEQILLTTVQTIVPSLVDTVVALDKKLIKVKVSKGCLRCFKRLKC